MNTISREEKILFRFTNLLGALLPELESSVKISIKSLRENTTGDRLPPRINREQALTKNIIVTFYLEKDRSYEELNQFILKHRISTLDYGVWVSDYGQFVVEATVGSEERVDAVFLSHCHSFYDKSAKGDAERRTFHEGIIATELRGQREFSWGSVICKYDAAKNRDWLVIIFNPFTNVPRKERHEAMVLTAHEEIPKKIARP